MGFKKLAFTALITLTTALFSTRALAQEYASPTEPPKTGKSPGMKVRELSSNGASKKYLVVFSPGDEVRGGLTEFAQKYNVKNAYYTAVGDALSMKVGWYDYHRKMFKVIQIDSTEIVSFSGNITLYNNKPVAHTHVSGADSEGIVRGGHLLEMIIGPTLEVSVTTDTVVINKKLDERYNAAVVE